MLHWLPKGLVYSSKNVSLNFSLVRRSCRFAGKIIRNILKQNTCLAHVQDMKFPEIGVPQNGWFMMETAIKIDDLGYPHLRKRVSSIIWPQLGDPWRPNLLQWRHQGYGCQPRQPGPGLSAQFSHVSHFSANMSISNLWQFSSIFPNILKWPLIGVATRLRTMASLGSCWPNDTKVAMSCGDLLTDLLSWIILKMILKWWKIHLGLRYICN